ncbi:hypothetical protein [Neotabrizicola sp. VNH66]|uniref:hypothetical protein n=1 Tax=Neotabrizicola sp. VNH66 TaxID=3400918 RepID=UPI003C041885
MRMILWAVAGAALGAALVILVAGVIVPSLTTVSQAEGAYAMGVIFVMAPAGAILGAIAGIVAAMVRRR